jgi:pseudouridine 5'-phosphatase
MARNLHGKSNLHSWANVGIPDCSPVICLSERLNLLDERDAAAHVISLFPNIPWTVDSYLAERNAGQDELWPTVRPLPGVLKLVQHLHSHHIPIAVATSSTRTNFIKKTSHLDDLFGLFEGRIVCGDDMRECGMRGKPWPDIFLTTALDKLKRPVGAVDTECTKEEKEERAKGLVFEDALLGLQAGKRAGMSGMHSSLPLSINKAVNRCSYLGAGCQSLGRGI